MADIKGEGSKLYDEAAKDRSDLLEELKQKLANSIENGLSRGTLKKGIEVAPKDYKRPSAAEINADMWRDMRSAKKFGNPETYDEDAQ